MIGKTISHYKIIEKLGGGGMGVVHKAQDHNLARFVALNFLSQSLRLDEEVKQRFVHEAKAASALKHPNICNIHEIDETDDRQIFIVMFCYKGETFKRKIESGPLKIFLSLLTFNKEALEFHKQKYKAKTALIHPNIVSI